MTSRSIFSHMSHPVAVTDERGDSRVQSLLSDPSDEITEALRDTQTRLAVPWHW